jgi:hypothetical protein
MVPTVLLACVPRTDGGPSVAPCTDAAGGVGSYPTSVTGYLLPPELVMRLEAATGPVPWATMRDIALTEFAIVTAVFAVAYVMGLIVKSVQ